MSGQPVPPTQRRGGPWALARGAVAACIHVLPALLALLMATAGGPAGAAAAAPAESAEPAGLADVRRLMGVDPAKARLRLQSLREQALAQRRADWRLRIDELECRLLTDVDLEAAERQARAGVAAAPAGLGRDDEIWLLRLRACHASALIDLGQDAAGQAELDAVLAATAAPELAAARAMALLERGVRRSRHGDLVAGQEDLLWACQTLARVGSSQDQELCLSHLANQTKRAGDLDEALRLLTRLLEGARERGASFDESIYLYGIAQVHAAARRWDEARRGFEASKAMEARRGDDQGLVYSEYGLADALLHLQRPAEALEHVRHALAKMRPGIDPQHAARLAAAQAEALVALGRPVEAEQALRPHEAAVRSKADDPQLVTWLRVQAQAQAALGRWREAFEAMRELREVESRLQQQQLSRESARLRQQFNRERDAQAIRNLQAVNEQGQRVRQAQAVALLLFVVLLAAALIYAARKLRETRRLRGLALRDELTGLPNRRAILEHGDGLLRELRRRPPGGGSGLSVLMIDADHFKSVNDRHGHAVGDEVLREIAQRLAGGLRGKDRLGRIGGEEFVALLPDADAPHALSVAERMRRLVAERPLLTAAGPLQLTVSIGVAFAADATAPELATLMERADAALYAAKTQGRDRVMLA